MPRQLKGQYLVQVESRILLALQLIHKMKYKQAEMLLCDALHLNKKSSKSLYLYSLCLKHQNLSDQSKVFEELAFSLNPCFFQTLDQNEQKITKKIGNIEGSIKKYLQKDLNGSNIKWQQPINTLAKQKDLASAYELIQLFEVHRKRDEDYQSHLFSTFGIVCYEVGDYEKSWNFYQTSIKIKPGEYRYYNNSAILLYISGQYQKSIQFVRKSLQLNEGYPKSFFIRCFSQCKVYGGPQALKSINHSISNDRSSTMYRFKKLTILMQYFPQNIQQLQSQLKQIQKIIKENKDTDSYFFNKDNRVVLQKEISFLILNLGNFCSDMLWRDYLQLLDNFLIRGHNEKFRISEQLKIKRTQIVQQIHIKTLDEVKSSTKQIIHKDSQQND